VCREGGAHVLGGSSEGEDLPVRFEASGARWHGVEVVAAGEGFSANEIANSACTPGSPSPGLNGWFSSFVSESPPVVAPARKPLLKLLRRPGRRSSSLLPERATARHLSAFCCSAGPPIAWGCSYLVDYLNCFTERELPRAKVMSKVFVSRRSRSPSARSALLSEAPLA
jgi:hypothetical protein